MISYEVVTKKLKKNRYNMQDLKQRGIKTTPFFAFEDNKENEIEEKKSEVPFKPILDSEPIIEEKKEKKKLRRLSMPKITLFDEVDDVKATQEKKLNDLINSDNYYDAIIPPDYDKKIVIKKDKKTLPIIAGIAIVVILSIALIVWSLS